MRKVETKLDEETIAAIIRSGETVYSFLQKAAKEKLNNDRLEKMHATLLSTMVGVFTERIGSYKTDASEVLNKNTEYLKILVDEIRQLKK